MAKNKLKRFADNATMDCVFQPNLETALADSFELKGKWHSDYFKNNNPIILELGWRQRRICRWFREIISKSKLHRCRY